MELDDSADLGKQWVLEVGYVGTHAVHLRETREGIQSVDASTTNPFTVTDVNGVQYQITSNTASNAVARTPTPGLNGYAGYQIFANDAYSHYHSLQTTVSRRWKDGYFQAAYTYSKSTDATSTGNTAFNTAYNDQSNINASRGLSDFDRPHRLVVSYVYDVVYRNGEGFKKAVLGGWGISGVTIFQSGSPFSIFDSGAGRRSWEQAALRRWARNSLPARRSRRVHQRQHSRPAQRIREHQ